MATDPLAAWWVHPVTIKPYGGRTPAGESWGDPFDVVGFVDDQRKLVRDATGAQVVAETTLALPADTPAVPLGSEVTLPEKFGPAVRTVLASSVGDGGGMPTPDHVELALA